MGWMSRLLGDKSIAPFHQADARSLFAVSNWPRQQGRVTSAKRVLDPWPRVFTGAIQMKTSVRVSINVDVAKCLRVILAFVAFLLML
ncbi:hypothetical protein BI380_32515 [Delftia tsuruhatensis]|uniref:Transposase n=2 Tax=Comamonadaceae TaxID=80864 RepID=A0ABN4SQG2_9BURK|nr:hypothetical protein BI380_03750 [Delftia tsuruhatensis]AOV05701.1 hypothetical protein BI380_32515 [Delftia tsuruhatensis]